LRRHPGAAIGPTAAFGNQFHADSPCRPSSLPDPPGLCVAPAPFARCAMS